MPSPPIMNSGDAPW